MPPTLPHPCSAALAVALGLFGAACSEEAELPSSPVVEPSTEDRTVQQPLELDEAEPHICEGQGQQGTGESEYGEGTTTELPVYGGVRPQSLEPMKVTAGGFCEGKSPLDAATLYLSADDSTSMASPVLVREMIRRGQTVTRDQIRVWEFLNYYDFDFEPAEEGQIRIVPQMGLCPEQERMSFQVGLVAPARTAQTRPTVNITFVMDTSGSMSGLPIELTREIIRETAAHLRAGDVVSMVSWSTVQSVMLEGRVVEGPNDPEVLAAADALRSGGGTDLHAGLVAGYTLAQANYDKADVHRLILISDGGANAGVTDEEIIGQYADKAGNEPPIYLAAVGVGNSYNDQLMDRVSDIGRGAAVFIPDADEVKRIFGERLVSMLDVAAIDVRLEMTLPWYFEVAEFYGEEISTDPGKVRPQHLSPNDAMVFFQLLRACDPAIVDGADHIRLRATWTTPDTREKRDAVVDKPLNDYRGSDPQLAKAAAIVAYAEAIPALSDTRLPYARRLATAKNALEKIARVPGGEKDPDLAEIAPLLDTLVQRYE